MILLIDNYDSFTYNLQHYLTLAGVQCKVKRNDESGLTSDAISKYDGIVLSPGPGIPQRAGNLMDIIATNFTKPILGICLGHQAIGVHFGAVIDKAVQPMHGKISSVVYHHHPMFSGIQTDNFDVVRYHSLVLKSVPEQLEVICTSVKEAEVMAISHRQFPVWGIQFHPEAALTQYGNRIISNWVNHFSLSKQ
jgi:anthranilate synthase component 2